MKTILYTLIFISTLNLYSQVFFLGGVKKSVPEKKVLNTNGVWKVDSNGTHIGIWKIEDLEAIKDELSEKYVLMNDLDFDKDEDYRDNSLKGGFTSGEGWAPIVGFRGDFEGNNKTISNLFINRPDNFLVGLFGFIDGSNIENIGILNCDITGGGSSVGGIPICVGGLVGLGHDFTIKNSYATGDITGDKHVGGLVGYMVGSTMETSYSKCTVAGNTYVGGLVGYSFISVIENSYATGDVRGTYYIGGLVGDVEDNSIINNSYATGSVTGTNYVGGLVGLNKNNSTIKNSIAFNDGIEDATFTNRVVGSNTSTITNNYANVGMTVNSNARSGTNSNSIDGANMTSDNMKDQTFFTTQANWDISIWDFTVIWEIKLGAVRPTLIGVGDDDGTLMRTTPEKGSNVSRYDDIWKVDSNGTHIGIWKIEDLEAIKDELSEKYVLMNDLDFDKDEDYRDNIIKGGFTSGEGWAPIYSFSGDFEGNNKTISNLFINRPDNFLTGLFGFIEGSNIENIGILNCDITGGGSPVGGVPGPVGSIPGSVGGLVGLGHDFTIKNSYATGDITGDKHVGGLVGYSSDSTIETSYSKCTVTGNTDVGGLVGYSFISVIENSYATGDVTGIDYIGGLVGDVEDNSIINNSYVTGSVTGTNYVGGLVGRNKDNSTIKNSIAFNDGIEGVEFTNRVVGSNNYTITNNYANVGMTVNSNARSGTNSNSIDGANMTSDNMKDQTFFTTQANWDISIWDFNIWEIKLGAVRPTLIGVGDDDGTIMR